MYVDSLNQPPAPSPHILTFQSHALSSSYSFLYTHTHTNLSVPPRSCHPLPRPPLPFFFEECGPARLFLPLAEGTGFPLMGARLGGVGWVGDGHRVSVCLLLYKYIQMCAQCAVYRLRVSTLCAKVTSEESGRNGTCKKKKKLCKACVYVYINPQWWLV